MKILAPRTLQAAFSTVCTIEFKSWLLNYFKSSITMVDCFVDYEMRGNKIGVTMAEKSAPKAPAFDQR